VPSYTFTATAEAVALCGAIPAFVEVDPVFFNMTAESLDRTVEAVADADTLRPAAVVPVDLFGIPAPYEAINAVAERHGLQVLADAAQSFGGSVGGRRVGSLAQVSSTSFFPAKPLGCYGDGGAIFTDDDRLYDVMCSIRIHGRASSKYDNARIGMNARLDTIQAAVLIEKMTIFDDELGRRQSIAARYAELLGDSVVAPTVPVGSVSAWAQYTLACERRDALQAALKDEGIPTQIYYPKPLHQQKPYAHCPVDPAGLAVTEGLSGKLISLPMHPYMGDAALRHIAGAVHAFFGKVPA